MDDKNLIPIEDIGGTPPPRKRKKYYIKQWLTLILVLLMIFAVKSCLGIGGQIMEGITTEKIEWSKLVMGDKLPDPKIKRGKIYSNSQERLSVNLTVKKDEKDAKFNDYLLKCADMGYSVEPESNGYSYEAHNKEGYKLTLYNSYKSLDVELEKPIAMGELGWASGEAGAILPKPKSKTGRLIHEYSDNYSVYVGETPKSEFDAYIQKCMDAGFNIEYNKSERDFYAKHKDGWRLSVEYEGNNIMRVNLYKSSID